MASGSATPGGGAGGGAGGPTNATNNGYVLSNPYYDLLNNDFIARRRERKEREGLLGGPGLEDTADDEAAASIAELEELYGHALPQAERERITKTIRRLRGGGWLEAAKADLVGEEQVPIELFNRLVVEHERTIGYMARRVKYYEGLIEEAKRGAPGPAPGRRPEAEEQFEERRRNFERTQRELWASVDRTRNRMTAIEQAVRGLYIAVGFPDEKLTVEEFVEQIMTRMRGQPGGEGELRMQNVKLSMDKNTLTLQLQTEREQNRALQDRIDRARPQAEMEHEMRIEYGLFNEEEVGRRTDATTQMYRYQRRDLLDNLMAARAICLDVSNRSTPDDQRELLRACNEYLNLLTLPQPRLQNPRQPRIPGSRPGQGRGRGGGGGGGGAGGGGSGRGGGSGSGTGGGGTGTGTGTGGGTGGGNGSGAGGSGSGSGSGTGTGTGGTGTGTGGTGTGTGGTGTGTGTGGGTGGGSGSGGGGSGSGTGTGGAGTGTGGGSGSGSGGGSGSGSGGAGGGGGGGSGTGTGTGTGGGAGSGPGTPGGNGGGGRSSPPSSPPSPASVGSGSTDSGGAGPNSSFTA